jgi:hypothetical protein
MANNLFSPLAALFGSVLIFGAGTLSQTIAPPQVSAAHQIRALSSIQTIGCSRSRDIHKKLWISLWMDAEQRRCSLLEGPKRRLRSNFEQF